MSAAGWAILAYLALAATERLCQSSARQYTEPGELRMRWSLYALYTTYTLIVIGSAIEFVFVRKVPVLWVSALGVAGHVCSVVLRKTAIRTLGRFWSLQVEIREQHQLVREGVYRFVRHPIYAAIVLEVLSLPLVANAWWTLAFACVTHVPLVLWRMRFEEQALVGKLGDSYRAYQREVGGLIPKRLTRNAS